MDGMPAWGQYALSGYIGGFTSHAMGGDFLKGAISAITVRAFNDLLHQGPPKLGRRRQWDFTDANEATAWSTGIAEETMKETFYIYNDETDMWMVEYRRKNKADAVYVDAEVRNIDGKKGIYVKRYHNGKRGKFTWIRVAIFGHPHIIDIQDGIGISPQDINMYKFWNSYGVEMEIMYNWNLFRMTGPDYNAYEPKPIY